jgi:hypothetical protein
MDIIKSQVIEGPKCKGGTITPISLYPSPSK